MCLVTHNRQRDHILLRLRQLCPVKQPSRHRHHRGKHVVRNARQVNDLYRTSACPQNLLQEKRQVVFPFGREHELVPAVPHLVLQQLDQTGQFSIEFSLDSLRHPGLISGFVILPGFNLQRILRLQQGAKFSYVVGERNLLAGIAPPCLVKRIAQCRHLDLC